MQSPPGNNANPPSPAPTSASSAVGLASARRSQLGVPPTSSTTRGTRPSTRSSPSTSSKLAKSMTKLGTAVYADGMHELADAHTLAVASGTQLVHCLGALKTIEAKVGSAHDTVTDVHDTLTAVYKAGRLRAAAVALRRAVDKCDSVAVGVDGGGAECARAAGRVGGI